MITRIKELINYYGISTRAFALKIGINQPTLDRMLKGINALNLNCVLAILSKCPEISADWLLCGEGEMLRSSNKEAERISKLIDTITTLQDAINTKSETIATLTEQIKKLENKK